MPLHSLFMYSMLGKITSDKKRFTSGWLTWGGRNTQFLLIRYKSYIFVWQRLILKKTLNPLTKMRTKLHADVNEFCR